MLTLSEAIAAIRALDTEPDIIERACNAVLGTPGEQLDSAELALHILKTYSPLVEDKGDLMLACIILGGRLAGVLTKPDSAKECMIGLHRLLDEEMTTAIAIRLHRELKKNPERGIKHIMEMAMAIGGPSDSDNKE